MRASGKSRRRTAAIMPDDIASLGHLSSLLDPLVSQSAYHVENGQRVDIEKLVRFGSSEQGDTSCSDTDASVVGQIVTLTPSSISSHIERPASSDSGFLPAADETINSFVIDRSGDQSLHSSASLAGSDTNT